LGKKSEWGEGYWWFSGGIFEKMREKQRWKRRCIRGLVGKFVWERGNSAEMLMEKG
jgi:hypothetical protein